MMFVHVSSHFTLPPSFCGQKSPGQSTTSSPWLQNRSILSKPRSLHSSGVQICAMDAQETAGFHSNLLQLIFPGRDGELISKITWCGLWKERLQTLGPLENHSIWCSKYSVITENLPTTRLSKLLLKPPFGDKEP